MGGICYMLHDKMLCGIIGNELMARIGPDKYDVSLTKPGRKKMDFTGRAMKGYVYIEADAIDTETDLEYWLQLCIDFNPLAKSSKKKTKKAPYC